MTILSPEFLSQYVGRQPDWGFNGLGYLVYKRTYSRVMPDGRQEEWADTVARCIEGAQEIGAQYTLSEAERLYDLMFNLKCSYAGRMLWQLGTDTVRRYGGASLLNCFSGETEFITEHGIKTFRELSGKQTQVRNRLGKLVDARVESFGTQKLLRLNLFRGKTKKSIYVTADHTWVRRGRRCGLERDKHSTIKCRTIDLSPGDKLVSVYGQSVKRIEGISPIGVMHGVVFGDGSIQNKNKTAVRLCGEKNSKLIDWFWRHPTYVVANGDVVVDQLPYYFKEKPDVSRASKNYLYGWLAGYFAADGSVSLSGQCTLSSANEDNLKFVRDVCVCLGITYTSITHYDRIGIGQTEPSRLYTIGFNRGDLTPDFFLIDEHRVRWSTNPVREGRLDWRVASLEETDRDEEVYCAVVPDGHEFVLEGNILTGNCWFVSMNDPEDFCFVFENLMLGGGVGFSVQRADIHDLPKVKRDVCVVCKNTKDADFIVPDSREGWVSLLRNVVQAFFVNGKSFTYSTILVRGHGEVIKGFGGTASGPGILTEGIQKIVEIFQSREGKKLRSIDVLDVCNIIGSVVVAGNVRRSAEIAIGDPDDYLYVNAKNWSRGDIPNWRAMSNNSISVDRFDHISRDVWENGYEKDPKTGMAKGEPYGFVNIPLSQRVGRLIDGPMRNSDLYPTNADNCVGYNPCAEIGLADGEACCLSEIFLNRVESPEELRECACLLYKTQKAIWTLPFHYDKTKRVAKKNMRVGSGVTAICQSSDKLDWLDPAYLALREYDKEWSLVRGWPESIKLTTVKPSGSLSLLAGATPGVHPAYSEYYIRRMRMSSSDPLVSACRDAGYVVEYLRQFDGRENRDTVVVEFPCEAGKAILAKDMTAVDQLKLVNKLQTVWADNSVSVTVYYREHELPEIKQWLAENYEHGLKTVSFLLHSGHGFDQAPYEEITRERYEEIVARVKPLTNADVGDTPLDVECAGGACPVR